MITLLKQELVLPIQSLHTFVNQDELKSILANGLICFGLALRGLSDEY